jgi:hypothetical protein
MKKAFLRKLLIGFSSVILFVYGVIYACGGGDDWGWAYDSNFTPETFVDKSYAPLFLSSDFFYNYSDIEHNSRFNDEIVSDWTKYLGGSAGRGTVKFFLVDSSAKEVERLYSYYKNKKSNPTSLKWGKKIKLEDYKVKHFVEFLHYSQQIEMASVIKFEYWSYETVRTNQFKDLEWIKSIESKYQSSRDPFVKNRYWFQVVKAYFYSSSPQNTVVFFNETANSVVKNTLYFRALSYVAGIEYKQKNYAKSNYLYSQVFDRCPSLRIVAAYSFHPNEQKDWNQALTMAKNNDEKAALWAIQGYYGDEEKAIESIYKLKPKSQHLDYLLTRLINNQERKIDKSFQDKTVLENKKRTKDSIAKSTIGLVTRIAQENQTAKPYLWDVAAGYLETLNGDFSEADRNFDKAESKMPKTLLAIRQLRLLRFVNNLSKIDQLNSSNEKTILKDLSWLYFELPKEKVDDFRYGNASKWSRDYLSALYHSQRNKILAELFVRKLGFYDNEKDLLAMKAFLSKPNKRGLEEIAGKVYELKLKDIVAYQAVKATFANKIPQAIVLMEQSSSKDVVFLGNPFNGNIKDCHDCEHLAYQKKKYTQIEFLNIIKVMQENVEKKVDVYANAMLLGNAFYNISHFGNARRFYEGNIVGFGSSPYEFNDGAKAMITDCSLAQSYYSQALANATTKEEKAKCHYMLAKCERNEYYNKKYYAVRHWWEIADDKINFLAWSGFKALKKEYSDTKYYQEVLAECGYFKTYVENYKQ